MNTRSYRANKQIKHNHYPHTAQKKEQAATACANKQKAWLYMQHTNLYPDRLVLRAVRRLATIQYVLKLGILSGFPLQSSTSASIYRQ